MGVAMQFLAYSQFLFSGTELATNQSWKQRSLVIRFIIRYICHTLLEYPHRVSQFEDRNWANFVSQHCSANIKVSQRASGWKFKRRLSRNQVESWGIKVVKARGQKSFNRSTDVIFDWIEPLESRFAQLMSVWKHYKFMASEKLQISLKCANKIFNNNSS